MNKKLVLGLLILGICIGGMVLWQNQTQPNSAQSREAVPIVSVLLPKELSTQAKLGKTRFAENCATCHGQNAGGQEGIAPPLVHKIYEPSHHGDESFQRAVALGISAHHWPFGNMSPVEGLDRDDVSDIIAYIRELQRANGIF